jgi:hypothetical protein
MVRKLPAYMTEILLEEGVKMKQTNKIACQMFVFLDVTPILKCFWSNLDWDKLTGN